MRIARGLTLMLTLGVAALAFAKAAHADGRWLDQRPLVQWNTPRMAIPIAPAEDLSFVDPRCFENQRPAETDEDEAVIAAGWRLIGAYSAGWGVRIITATGGYDGMCRPVGYQQFVFADGLFAGTTSPDAMASRADGAAGTANLSGPNRIFISFARYSESDPLCCPSASSFASYEIDRSSGAPVLVVTNVSTESTR